MRLHFCIDPAASSDRAKSEARSTARRCLPRGKGACFGAFAVLSFGVDGDAEFVLEEHSGPGLLGAFANERARRGPGGRNSVLASCGFKTAKYSAHKRRDRSSVRGGTGPAARILSPSSKATDGALCVTSREAGAVFTAGSGGHVYQRYPPSRRTRTYGFRSGLRSCPRGSPRGTKGFVS